MVLYSTLPAHGSPRKTISLESHGSKIELLVKLASLEIKWINSKTIKQYASKKLQNKE
jgi:hypothetical protein